MLRPKTVSLKLAALVACATFMTGAVNASTVYKKTGPDGAIEFSDTPGQQDAERIEIETPTTYSAPTRPPTYNQSPTPATQQKGYAKISIVSPANDTTMRSNSGNLTVTGRIAPRLKRNHQVVLKSNGATLAGPQRALTFSVNNLDRGTHSLTISVVDDQGNTLKTSGAITINILRATAPKKAPPRRPPPRPARAP